MPSLEAIPSIDSVSQELNEPVVVLVGPTAVGKTEIAVELAEQLSGEIVSVDSRLLYRGMDIGTAKPTEQERRQIPHYLVDVTDPDDPWSLPVFQAHAQAAIAGILQRDHLPILVGGTGQYVRAVTEAWQPPTIAADMPLRKALEAWTDEIGVKGLHDRLAVLDPEAAQIIDYRNLRRTIRALEVVFLTGEKFSDQRRRISTPYCIYQIGLSRPRAELFARIDDRIDKMFEKGLVSEVRALLDKGYPDDLPAFSAIGYREVIAFLHGKISLEETQSSMRRATRRFVRRQANWFKPSDPNIHWYPVEANTVRQIIQDIHNWLVSIKDG